MPVVADGDADQAGLGLVDRRSRIAGSVVALLVEARVLGDVGHAGHAQDVAIGVDHRRAVVGLEPVALEEVHHHDHAAIARLLAEGGHGRTVERLGQAAAVAAGGLLRIEPLEGQLGEAHHHGAGGRRLVEGGQSALHVGGLVPGRVLLDEGDLHGRQHIPGRRREPPRAST